MNPRISILYIDDEVNNLDSFYATFRRDYKIFVTSQASEAVEILRDNTVHIILADQKMPEVSGVEFLELVRSEFPDPIRMLMTGYADIQAVIDAINKGQIYSYIAKPWEEQNLKVVFQNAYKYYQSRVDLKESNEQLLKTNSALREFVYSVSHDLRSPIVSVEGVTQLMEQESDPFKLKGYAEMVNRSMVKLNLYTQNIIYFYNNIKDDVMPTELDLNDWIPRQIHKLSNYEGAHRIDIDFDVKQSGPFRTDEERLKIILNNLIINSIEHIDAKKERCKAELQIEADSNALKAILQDNGRGIAKEKLRQVQKMFSHTTHYEQGSGLGLFIVKEAISKLGGEIAISSTEGEGTKVEATIPVLNG